MLRGRTWFPKRRLPQILTPFWKVALAVFAGNIVTGILAAIIYASLHRYAGQNL